jgi:hypothetical protein
MDKGPSLSGAARTAQSNGAHMWRILEFPTLAVSWFFGVRKPIQFWVSNFKTSFSFNNYKNKTRQKV